MASMFEDDSISEQFRVEPAERSNAMEVPLLVLCSITSLLSMTGSGCIIYMARRDLDQMLQRLLLGLSLGDLIMSLSFFLFPFLYPSEVGTFLSSGNLATCTALGFFLVLGAMLSCFYSSSLSIYYLASVRYNWKDRTNSISMSHRHGQQWNLPAWEIALHFMLLVTPLCLVISAAATDIINPMEFMPVCLFDPYPWGCEDIEGIECKTKIRQVHIHIGIVMFFITSATITGLAATIMVYITVRDKLKKSNQFRADAQITASMKQSTTYKRSSSIQSEAEAGEQQNAFDRRIQQVRTQAILYSIAYLNTYIWPAVLMAVTQSMTPEEIQDSKSHPFHYTLQVIALSFAPAQGFFNFFIYTRLKVKRWRDVEPDHSILWIWGKILGGVAAPSRRTSSAARRNNRSKNSSNKNETDDSTLRQLPVGGTIVSFGAPGNAPDDGAAEVQP